MYTQLLVKRLYICVNTALGLQSVSSFQEILHHVVGHSGSSQPFYPLRAYCELARTGAI
jgi:hypothetical protein